MVYVVADGKISFHPWGGSIDELGECAVIEDSTESQALMDHLDRGPQHPMNDEIKRILRQTFAS